MIRAAVAASLCAATVMLAGHLRDVRERPYDVAVVPGASLVRVASLGHPTLAANAYWLRAVQYIGDPRANERGWDHLYPLVDLVTDLDPAHGYAYQVAGIVLGTAGRVTESNALLEKGIRLLPTRYMIPLLRGFNAFHYDGDYDAAARFMELAARTPGAPKHVSHYVLAFAVKGERPQLAVALLSELLREAKDPETRSILEQQLKQALLEREALALDDAVATYRERYGLPPFSLALLVPEGLARAVPADPFGGELVIGPDGRVRSSINDFRFKRRNEVPSVPEPGLNPEHGYPGVRIR